MLADTMCIVYSHTLTLLPTQIDCMCIGLLPHTSSPLDASLMPYAWSCRAGGRNSSLFVDGQKYLAAGYYYNVTIWYYQNVGPAGLVLAGSISGTPQVGCCLHPCPFTPTVLSVPLNRLICLSLRGISLHFMLLRTPKSYKGKIHTVI